ncbi:LuxR C-terminal-related transcriptional regulator [Arthrobacter sp.]|uniref:response regulator transcription factor n=1 Tax=Arthrobacter sp. TaxID=1667 RepID=UPI00339B8FAD
MTRSDDVSLNHPDVVGVVVKPSAPPAGLTRRELQVLTLMTDGLTNAEIASQLVLSVRTVTTHVEHILRNWAVRAARRARLGQCRTGLRLFG